MAKVKKKASGSSRVRDEVLTEGKLRDSDLGSPIQIARGVVEYRDDVTIQEDPADPTSRQWRAPRAQKIWVPDRLLRKGTITQEQYDAAARFYTDYLIGECGARPGEAPGMRVRLDPWNRLPYSEQRAMRRQSFRFAVKAVSSPSLSAVLVWTILQETGGPDLAPTLEAFAERQQPKRWPIDRATGLLVGALDALSNHYGYSRPDPSSGFAELAKGPANDG